MCGCVRAVCVLFVGVIGAAAVELRLEGPGTGYFIKPLFGPGAGTSPDPRTQRDLFVVTSPRGPVTVHAEFGPFSAEDTVPLPLLLTSLGNHSDVLGNTLTPDLDISAHLVTRSLAQDRPYIQLLFHAIPNNPRDTTPWPTTESSSPASRWCMQMHVVHTLTTLTSVCVLSAQENACVAELTLPSDWWTINHVPSVAVYYSVYSVRDNLQCSSAPQTLSSDTDSGGSVSETAGGGLEGIALPRSYVGEVTLARGELTYQQVAEDQHILLYIPQKSFYPGSKFRLPVRLQAESDLTLFVVRVKARHGLKILGAEAVNTDKWRITVNMNQKRHGAMVTAFIHNKKKYNKTDRIQPIFEWIFEVEDGGLAEDDPGRIILNLEYEMTSSLVERYGSVTNRVVARVHIQHDNVVTIVPVVKTTKLMNTAMLTGDRQTFPMQIFSLGQGGRILDITAQTTCHSGDVTVLKVSESCDVVYLDGTETKGSPSVSVIAKYGRHTKFIFFKVWTPEIPLTIELSDNKLSQVKGWKAPRINTRLKRDASESVYDEDEDEEVSEGQAGEQADELDFSSSCHLKFQTSVVEVYAHFSLPDETRSQYLTHRKAAFRVTGLVEDRLRVADSSIVSLSGNILEGLQPGRTEVQVLSDDARVIGAAEIKVGNNKVSLSRLDVTMVTGISVATGADVDLPQTLLATVTKHSQLHRKNQEGVLDIRLQFSDGSSVPLHDIPPSDYFLDMDTLNNAVVAFGPMLRPDTPRVIALAPGKGELLKIALELGDACSRKKSRPLKVEYVYINVDFSKAGQEGLMSDAGHYSKSGYGSVEPDSDVVAKGISGSNGKVWEAQHEDGEYMYNNLEGFGQQLPGSQDKPSHEAQQQPVGDSSMSALEIGMYVLLAVFCLAIFVFLGNCMVFVVRYRKKTKPYAEATENVANAHDWVWIGRATLERNAINTGCQQRLVSDTDFNGNPGNDGFNSLGHSSTSTINPLPSNLNMLRAGNTHTVPVVRHSATTSNRNSLVSTYKGSECSIRITSNPHHDAARPSADSLTRPDNKKSAQTVSRIPPSPPIPESSSDEEMEAAANSTTTEPVPPPVPPHAVPLPSMLERQRQEKLLSASVDGPNQPESHVTADACNNNMSDVEWDYEAMGMTYEQLMRYFDNLKESTA